VILAGFVMLMLLIAGGLVSLHNSWKKEALICWTLAVLLCLWLYPALAGA